MFDPVSPIVAAIAAITERPGKASNANADPISYVAEAVALVQQLQFISMVGIGLNENFSVDDYDRLAGKNVKPKRKWWKK